MIALLFFLNAKTMYTCKNYISNTQNNMLIKSASNSSASVSPDVFNFSRIKIVNLDEILNRKCFVNNGKPVVNNNKHVANNCKSIPEHIPTEDVNIKLSKQKEIHNSCNKSFEPIYDKSFEPIYDKSFEPIYDKSFEPIRLEDYQTQHVKNMVATLINNVAVLDFSEAGLGKSFAASAVVKIFGSRAIVIAPGTVINDVWTKMEEKYGLNIHNKLTYSTLVGREGCSMAHNYLERTGATFTTTEHLRKLIKEGIIFIFDEMATTKNKGTLRFKAVHTIVNEIINIGPKSRVINISALPRDKIEQIQTLCQILGIVRSENYWTYDNNKGYIIDGIVELMEWCKDKDPVKTLSIIGEYMKESYYISCENQCRNWMIQPSEFTNLNRTTIPILVARLFREIVHDEICHQMLKPTLKQNIMNVGSITDRSMVVNCGRPPIKNVFYKVCNNDRDLIDVKLMDMGSKILKSAVSKRSSSDPNKYVLNQGEIIKGFRITGKSMLRILYYVVREELRREPDRKFVIGAWFIDQIQWLENVFSEYGVRSIYGKTNQDERRKSIKKFQENSDKCKIIIVNPTVGGEGISLDDQYGNRPRTLLVLPDNRFMKLVQFTYRVWRAMTKSKSETKIHVVFSPHFIEQLTILNNLVNKSSAARTVIKNSNLSLPKDYGQESIDIKIDYEIALPPLPSKSGNTIV